MIELDEEETIRNLNLKRIHSLMRCEALHFGKKMHFFSFLSEIIFS